MKTDDQLLEDAIQKACAENPMFALYTKSLREHGGEDWTKRKESLTIYDMANTDDLPDPVDQSEI